MHHQNQPFLDDHHVAAPGQEILDAVVLGMSAEDHIDDLHGDLTGFGLLKYKSWYNIKYVRYPATTAKLYIIVAVGDRIVALGYAGNGSRLAPTQGDV